MTYTGKLTVPLPGKDAMPEYAFCGQICAECPVYHATIHNDQASQIWLAAEYASSDYALIPTDIHCTGCHKQGGNLSRMCASCQIRACAVKRVRSNCSECPQYPCSLIERFVPIETDNRAILESLHQMA